MGVGGSVGNPQFTATNYSLDYSCNLINPGQPQIMQRLGPNAANFPDQSKNQLLNDMTDSIHNADPSAAASFKTYSQYLYACFGLFFVGIIVVVVMTTSASIAYATPVMIVCWAGGIIGFCVLSGKIKAIQTQWRNAVLTRLEAKLQEWKQQNPAFTFTIIYPVEVWRRSRNRNGRSRRRLVAIWVYVRVTQGPCQTGANEPIYRTSSNTVGQVVVQQPMVMQQQQPIVVNQNGQQVVYQQPVQQQQVVYQQQPMVVNQNGQQVVYAQQPQQQQVVYQQAPQQQQVVYQQQPQVIVQQPMQQGQPQQIAYQQQLNTVQQPIQTGGGGDAPPAFNPDINDAPPTYDHVDE